jgi:hypothetical protein
MRKPSHIAILCLILTACATSLPPSEHCPGHSYLAPEQTEQVKKLLQNAGTANVYGSAWVTGFRCTGPAEGMERYKYSNTNFDLVFQVKSLSNVQTLGNRLKETLVILDALLTENTPQKDPGNVGVHFETDNEKYQFRFSLTKWQQMRNQNLNGTELLEAMGSTLAKDRRSTPYPDMEYTSDIGQRELRFTVKSLSDIQELGNIVGKSLVQLQDSHPEGVPTPDPEQIWVGFETDTELYQFRFSRTQLQQARAQGLTGVSLLEALGSTLEDINLTP